MNSFISPDQESATGVREWHAHLRLGLQQRGGKTVLATTHHVGPLRVQRPFYPEADGCCHVYLLHPPGGMVIGDSLQLDADIGPDADALLTTPSAGKIYGARGSQLRQQQKINLNIENGACLEWLPQETIVFDGANGNLQTVVRLMGNAKFFGWDIVHLGRTASGENFISGQCKQTVEVWRDDKPLFIERNKFVAGSGLMQASWGMRNANTTGTLLTTVKLQREKIDQLVAGLNSGANNLWGLTQKGDVFIARYLGDSASVCRKGFEYLWREIRPDLNGKQAVIPRIWNT